MKEFKVMEYFKPMEDIVDVLCKQTQNTDRNFFRIMVTYYLTKVTSMMRCTLDTDFKGKIPINMYAINLAGSGL